MAYIDTENMPLHMPVPGSREPAQIALLNENCVTLSNHDHTNGKGLAIGRLRSGLEANRPAAGSAGNVYFATDTGRFYVDTGTAWVQFITEGGQATVTGWTLIDPVIRDTLQWGPEGSGTIDATLTRTGPGDLLLSGAQPFLGFRATGNTAAGYVGQAVGTEARLDLDVNAHYEGTTWVQDDPAKPSTLVSAGVSAASATGSVFSVHMIDPGGSQPNVKYSLRKDGYSWTEGLVGARGHFWGNSEWDVAAYLNIEGSNLVLRRASDAWVAGTWDWNGSGNFVTPGVVQAAILTANAAPASGVGVRMYDRTGAASYSELYVQAAALYVYQSNVPAVGLTHIVANQLGGWNTFVGSGTGHLDLRGADNYARFTDAAGSVEFLQINPGADRLTPANDGAVDCGWPDRRWRSVHSTSGYFKSARINERATRRVIEPQEGLDAILATPVEQYTLPDPEDAPPEYQEPFIPEGTPEETAAAIKANAEAQHQEALAKYDEQHAVSVEIAREPRFGVSSETAHAAVLFRSDQIELGTQAALAFAAIQALASRIAALEGQRG